MLNRDIERTPALNLNLTGNPPTTLACVQQRDDANTNSRSRHHDPRPHL